MTDDMNLITLPLEDIHPYINNPRKNDGAVKDVEECIRQCGYNSPIVVDENHVILAGHTRLKALQKLGRTEAQVVVREGLTDEQKRLYRIADNKTGEEAEWDFGKLEFEIDGLDLSGFDFEFDLGDIWNDSDGGGDDADLSAEEQDSDFEASGQQYGVPYMGGKSRIAEWVMSHIPEADTFVDLFAGGGAITHCAMLSGKYENFIANDIDGSGLQLFLDAIAGKYADAKAWVSREDFFGKKDTDPYVRWVWSFGNDGRTYLYGKDIEECKHAIHEMICADTIKERRLLWSKMWREHLPHSSKLIEDLQRLERLQKLEALQDLQRLERLQKLEALQDLQQLERLRVHKADYAEIEIPNNAVIYCDIPYYQTSGYDGSMDSFDHERFYTWACSQTQPIFISEYFMPEDRFECIDECKILMLFSASGNTKGKERLYVPKK